VFPVTKAVTSKVTHCAEANEPEDAVTVEAGCGAFPYVIVFSDQVLLLTARTLTGADEADAENTRKVACVTLPFIPVRLNRMYVFWIGDVCARSRLSDPKFAVARFWATYESATVVNVEVVTAAPALERLAATVASATPIGRSATKAIRPRMLGEAEAPG
jgi:hypothetical protein